HGHLVLARLLILHRETAAESRNHSKGVEVIPSDARHAEAFGIAITREIQVQRHRHRRRKLFEGRVLFSIIKEVDRRDAGAVTAVADVSVDPDETVGLAIWQRPDHNGIDEAEDGCVSADAERERKQRDERKTRTLQEAAKAIADVFDDRVHVISDCRLPIADCQLPIANLSIANLSMADFSTASTPIGNRQLAIGNAFIRT